ncbi:MAG: hypothetical protein WCW68_05940 [Methanothrix sp.]
MQPSPKYSARKAVYSVPALPGIRSDRTSHLIQRALAWQSTLLMTGQQPRTVRPAGDELGI